MAIAVGGAATEAPAIALVLAGSVAVLLAAMVLRPPQAVALLVIASYMTRVRVPIAGMGFRLEHVATVVLLGVVVLRRPGRLASGLRNPGVVALLAFVAWSAVVSLARSPDPLQSMQIVGWIALDALTVLAILASGSDGEETWTHLVRYGVWAAAIGIGAWMSATFWGTSVGVQQEILTGALAVYGLSFEANIFGATMALLLMGVVSMGIPKGVRTGRLAVYVLPVIALLLSFTRAAALGLVAGAAVWAAASRSLRERSRVLAGAAIALLVLTLMATAAPTVARPLIDKALLALDFSGGTGAVRAETWSVALHDMSPTDWVVGRGANTFGQYHSDATVPELDRPGYIGNLPLQLVYDSGLVGTALLLVALLWAMPRGRTGRARAVAMLTVYVACALATSPFWFATTWLYFTIGLRSHKRGGDERAGRRQLGTGPRRPVVDER